MKDVKKEVKKAKEFADVSKKLDAANKELKARRGYLESDIRFKRDTTSNANDVRSATKKVESLKKELDRLR